MTGRDLIEAVPNVSEGRDRETLEQLVAAVSGTPGVALLHVHTDEDHNRSVFTYVSDSAEALHDATLNLYESALARVDMRNHQGEHPRVGVVDVCPFVPLGTRAMAECVDLARRVGTSVGSRFNLPVYLYEEAASAPHRRELPDVRRGEFEGFPEKMQLDAWIPDFGPRAVHPRWGVTIVGARVPLIAFNVQLDTDRVEVAARIARAVRASSGGLRFVRAIPVHLHHRSIVQVSMNVLDFKRTPIHRAIELVRSEARRFGVNVMSSEIVGLVPREAMFDVAAWYLQLEGSVESVILEQRIEEIQEKS